MSAYLRRLSEDTRAICIAAEFAADVAPLTLTFPTRHAAWQAAGRLGNPTDEPGAFVVGNVRLAFPEMRECATCRRHGEPADSPYCAGCDGEDNWYPKEAVS